MKRFLPALLMLLMFSVPAVCLSFAHAEGQHTRAAAGLFRKYMRYEDRFDPRLADLYAKNALINVTRLDQATGESETLHIPPMRYREMIRQHIGFAKRERDKGRYSNIHYAEEGDNVRIHAERLSLSEDYSAPLTLLVGSDADGEWVILEEFSEIRK